MKKTKKKNYKPKIKIDLHGFTVQEAYEYVFENLEFYESDGLKEVEVVTGKSGQIRKEFPNWLDAKGYTSTVADHDGSFTVFLN
jgi:DNA-nicking Smr family endonuclease